MTKQDFRPVDVQKAQLGQLLFYDPLLSGNRNISCGTCHNPDFGTSDGLSLGIGEGGHGLGPKRHPGTGDNKIRKRIPRNSTALWNLGAKEVSVLFHDGRASVANTYENGFDTPAEEWLPNPETNGLEDILAAQAIFPLTSQFEMAGNPKENQVAGAAHDRIDYVWPIIAKRVRTIPQYGRYFVDAFDHISRPEEVTIVEIGNALSHFMNFEWRSHDSPFDAWLAGDKSALNDQQQKGLALFFGEANCASCHSGPLFTDHDFHALALPHFGPGRTRRFDPYVRDVGRMGETDLLEDAYRFRTPSLRNIALTAPYGHNGAYPSLDGIIRHHLDPRSALENWKPEFANLPSVPWLEDVDFVALEDRLERQRLASKIDIAPVELADAEIAALVAFLHGLTGTTSIKGRLGKPETVPSGLPVE